jgi:hypothetical protein
VLQKQEWSIGGRRVGDGVVCGLVCAVSGTVPWLVTRQGMACLPVILYRILHMWRSRTGQCLMVFVLLGFCGVLLAAKLGGLLGSKGKVVCRLCRHVLA